MEGGKAGKTGASSSGDIFDAHAFDVDIPLGQVLAQGFCVWVLQIIGSLKFIHQKTMKKYQHFEEKTLELISLSGGAKADCTSHQLCSRPC